MDGTNIRAGYASRDRAIYNFLLQQPEVQGKAKPTKSYLRQEQVIVNGLLEYPFDFKEQNGGVQLPQRAIKTTDMFFVTRIGVFLGKEILAKKAAQRIKTYPDPSDFVDGGAFTAQNLYTIYNGLVYSKTDKSIVFDGIPMIDFLKVPNKQSGEVAGVKETERIAKEDFLDIEPIFTLDGRNDNTLYVKFANPDNIALASPDVLYTHKIVMILEGYYGLGYAKN